ncbi:hypothetical protein LRAMOSA01259 [Lichtheimia ramosa]|uniref:Uncharacterized protein n=1 Tax=Lichtheimia ramosa TaxID=688394 RepID=A0A077WIY2_9FUNG|nr:hypothetical protein LRAMOSA01259 [Lichtheimia ramosa]
MNNPRAVGDIPGQLVPPSRTPPAFKKQQVLGKRPLRTGQGQPSGPRDPFGPPAPLNTTLETLGPQEELLRKQTEEYNIRQSMKATMAQAKATSSGFFVSKPSRHENFLIPAIPRSPSNS